MFVYEKQNEWINTIANYLRSPETTQILRVIIFA